MSSAAESVQLFFLTGKFSNFVIGQKMQARTAQPP